MAPLSSRLINPTASRQTLWNATVPYDGYDVMAGNSPFKVHLEVCTYGLAGSRPRDPLVTTQQTRNIYPVLAQCWASVADDGPALSRHYSVFSVDSFQNDLSGHVSSVLGMDITQILNIFLKLIRIIKTCRRFLMYFYHKCFFL